MIVRVIKDDRGLFDMVSESGEGMYNIDIFETERCARILKPDFVGLLDTDFLQGQPFTLETTEELWKSIF